MDFISFGSGSSGNCYYIRNEKFGIIIDGGIGIRKFKKYFRDYGLSFGEVNAVLVTHDHADHVRAVGAMSQEFHWPVYALKDVYMGMERNRFVRKKVPKDLANHIEPEQAFEIGPFRVTPFEVPHDSAANCGYSISVGDVRFCLVTDAGHVTDAVRNHLSQADYLVVEANYDAEMLENGPYPKRLKDRIRGELGHMDNAETGRLLAEHLSPTAKHVWLCHLSEENNQPSKAVDTVCQALKSAGRLGEDDGLVVEALMRTHPSRLYSLL